MLNLDQFVDALEEEVASKGVMGIDLQKFAPSRNNPGESQFHHSNILTEMLRVWMEHRWRAGYPVYVADCLNQFPDETFSDQDLDKLRFEEQRLRKNSVATLSRKSEIGSIEQLPKPGVMWGEFELLGVLGVGAFAKVYLARQHGLAGRLVALKLTFRPTRESHWLATLQHTSIVPIYSTHRVDQVYGLCMPFLGNSTMADLLHVAPQTRNATHSHWWSTTRGKAMADGGMLFSTIRERSGQIDTIIRTARVSSLPQGQPWSESEATSPHHSAASYHLRTCDYIKSICWIGSQLADALAYAHGHGVIHSDIKPANVLLAFDGQPLLLDFNVSYEKTADGVVGEDAPLGGTLPYMSPEHRHALQGSAIVDARSDIYSLGVVLYEMLTGRLPIPSVGATHPSQWNASVSPAMSAIISKCLEMDPANRYQSAAELRDDLNAQFLNEPLVHLSEPSQAERFLKWCRRNPRLSSSLSVASLALTVVVFLVTSLVMRQIALNKADWVHRMDLLQESIPTSMAMLTSLDVAPDLESDASAKLQETFAIVGLDNRHPTQVDPRWEKGDGVSNDLRSELRLLASLAMKRDWRQPLSIPNSLLENDRASDANSLDGPIQEIGSLIQTRAYSVAIDLLKKRIDRNPRDYVGWWLLGDCYHANREFANAQQAYTVCIALRPNMPVAYLNRGMARFSDETYGSAADDYAKVASLAPAWNWSRLNYALCLQKAGRVDNAIAELDAAIAGNYRTVSVYRLRGDLCMSKGDAIAARRDYDNAMQCEPKTDQEWVDRGLIQLNMNPANAAKDFEQALNLNPNSIDAHQKLAFVYAELLGNAQQGLQHCDRLVELAPWQPTHRAGRSVLHARAGRLPQALEDLEVLNATPLQDALVNYQVACSYSLLASMAQSNGQDFAPFSESAFDFLALSLRLDPTILEISKTDPDVSWIREQPEYQAAVRAVATLYSKKK